MNEIMKDWTQGVEALVYQTCSKCSFVWYFRRSFCPRCGHASPQSHKASGRGVIQSATMVYRAPSPELRALAPYKIALVDVDEGFRLMAHVAPQLNIGDAVQGRFVKLGETLIPYFDASPTTA
jgi:uncharacterized OB-fold protein